VGVLFMMVKMSLLEDVYMTTEEAERY